MRSKRIAAVITSMILSLAASGCGTSTSETASHESSSMTTAEKTPETKPASQSSENTSHISRRKRNSESPMGDAGTWTIFVYLCGSDLEVNFGSASADLTEMINSSANDKVKYVVQTGGAASWEMDISSDASERFVIQNGKCERVYSGPDVDMGSSDVLADFLKWGISEYPAANMGLILWDHGSGSINGACFDDNHGGNCLLLKDIDAALYSVYDQMTEPFEFIGFDACLMSTAETAAVMATHARYFIGSQDIEPGSGWNYKNIGDYLAQNPECTGAELGKVVVDSFYSDCAEIGREDGATLAVIDLSKIDTFIEAFDKYAKDVYELTESGADFSPVARNINRADNFGGNNRSSGFTNMVDIGGIIAAGKDISPNSDPALKALNDCVIYMKNGSDHTEASGLSVYYPLQIRGSQELAIFKDIALSSYYLGLVDKVAYGQVNGGIDDYDNSGMLDMFSNDWSSDQYSESGGFLEYAESHYDEWNYADNYTPGTGETNITFDSAPDFDENGDYSFVLSQNCIDEVDHIEGGIFVYDEGGQFAFELGSSGEVYGDYETGAFTGTFDGYWFALPDGQFLPAYIQEYCDGYDIYTAPILLNGEQTNLRFAYFYGIEDQNIEIIDVWDGVDENGSVARSGSELRSGDKIVPLYYTYILDPDIDIEDGFIDGDEYTYTDDTQITFNELDDSEYLYCFYVYDIYGNYDMTDFVKFTIAGDMIRYEKFE